MYTRFLPAISKNALKEISGEVRSWRLHLRKVNNTFAGLATMINPVVAGAGCSIRFQAASAQAIADLAQAQARERIADFSR